MRTALPVLALLIAAPAQAGETRGGPSLVLTCPAKGPGQQLHDLSSGVAPWVVRGPGIPAGEALASAIAEPHVPRDWSARLPGTYWVQGLPQTEAAPHAPGDYVFELTFTVPRSKRLPRLVLAGQVAGDEGLDLTLIEPSPPGSFIGGGTGGADDSPGVVRQEDLADVDLRLSADGSGRPLGQRAGLYRLQLNLPNGTGHRAMLGLLARLHLTVSCGARK